MGQLLEAGPTPNGCPPPACCESMLLLLWLVLVVGAVEGLVLGRGRVVRGLAAEGGDELLRRDVLQELRLGAAHDHLGICGIIGGKIERDQSNRHAALPFRVYCRRRRTLLRTRSGMLYLMTAQKVLNMKLAGHTSTRRSLSG